MLVYVRAKHVIVPSPATSAFARNTLEFTVCAVNPGSAYVLIESSELNDKCDKDDPGLKPSKNHLDSLFCVSNCS